MGDECEGEVVGRALLPGETVSASGCGATSGVVGALRAQQCTETGFRRGEGEGCTEL